MTHKFKHPRFSKILAFALVFVAFSCVALPVLAQTTTDWTLSNWDINSLWGGQSISGFGNYTLTAQFAGVQMTNASNTGSKICFSIIDGSNNGYEVDVWVGASALTGYLSVQNTVSISRVGVGSTLLWQGQNCNASQFQLAYTGDHIDFYINGQKVYQNTASVYTPTEIQYFTNDVSHVGDITLPSCFTGSFFVAVNYYSGSSVGATFDTSQMSSIFTTLITLMIAMLPLMIYMAVFKMIPKMLRGLHF